MSVKDFLKRCLMEYFVVTTCVTAAMAILGIALEPEARFGYEAFFSPLLFGLLSLIPSLVTYTRKELSLRRTLLRKVLYVILLEALLLGFSFYAGVLRSLSDAFSFALTVLAVYITVNLISWRLDKKEAAEINKLLKALQRSTGQE